MGTVQSHPQTLHYGHVATQFVDPQTRKVQKSVCFLVVVACVFVCFASSSNYLACLQDSCLETECLEMVSPHLFPVFYAYLPPTSQRKKEGGCFLIFHLR